MNRKFTTIALILGGGALTAAGLWYGAKKSSDVEESIETAISSPPPPFPLSPSSVGRLPTVDVRLTGYWPLRTDLTKAGRKMEGGPKDRMSRKIHTLEQHMRDPITHPYVSVAGDWRIWPDGQRVILSPWPNLIFRIVDTGGNFYDSSKTVKIYRVTGREPLDVAVDGPDTVVPKTNTTAKIVAGDTFGPAKTGPRAVVASGFRGQNVVLGFDDTSGAVDDCEALARAIESELGGRPQHEQIAVAWVLRNRAETMKQSVGDLLAPLGVYGSSERSGGHVSTRRIPTALSREIADAVLRAREADPTDGAVDFWLPAQQAKMRQLGDVYRAARQAGDSVKTRKYARYAEYGTEEEVRAQYTEEGLCPVMSVGSVELLKRGG